MTFWDWGMAMRYALAEAVLTGSRFRVFSPDGSGWIWTVTELSPSGRPARPRPEGALLEPCS